MAQPYFNPVEFGEAESRRLAGYRARLLANHGQGEPDAEVDDERPGSATLWVAVLSAISGAAVTMLVLSVSGWIR